MTTLADIVAGLAIVTGSPHGYVPRGPERQVGGSNRRWSAATDRLRFITRHRPHAQHQELKRLGGPIS